MEHGLTDHIWSVAELIEHALAAPPLEPLPLPYQARRTDRRPFRLRVVRGGKIS